MEFPSPAGLAAAAAGASGSSGSGSSGSGSGQSVPAANERLSLKWAVPVQDVEVVGELSSIAFCRNIFARRVLSCFVQSREIRKFS